MTSKHTKQQLSPYQHAMLTHMGITCWKSKDSSAVAISPEISTREMPKANRVPSAEQKEAGIAKLKQQLTVEKPSATIDAKQNIVLCFNEQKNAVKLMEDVLVWLGLEERTIVRAEKPIEQYRNYALAWCVDDDFRYSDNTLFTPPLNKLMSVNVKKQLWTLLQRYPNT